MINLLSLLDDVAATMDDVAVMTKVALKKTSALMTDDLAVNAAVVQGVDASRELPIVWSIFLGSIINKIICIGIVLLINYSYPPLLTWILLLGGCYLAFEGADKIFEKLIEKFTDKSTTLKKDKEIVSEKQKIWGAIKTDLVLSMEIIVLAQTGLEGEFLQKLLTLSLIGFSASLLIYGLVAFLVKIDDFGLVLLKNNYQNLGMFLVNLTPKMMKFLGIIGTIAMLMVAGGIFTHTFHLKSFINEYIQNLALGLIFGSFLVFLIRLLTKFAFKK